MGVETEVNAKLNPTELKLKLGLSLAILDMCSMAELTSEENLLDLERVQKLPKD